MRGIFEDSGFTPTGKIVGNQSFSIVSDHLGTPIAMYDSRGSAVWNQTLSIWGERESRGAVGDPTLCPFRYPGQYEDDETGLYYNRLRYFDPSIGEYVSVDPIGLAGGNPTLFGYVGNPMGEYDPFGLAKCGATKKERDKAWRSAREKYWRKEGKNNSGRYSSRNLDRMRKGSAPQFEAKVRNTETRKIETKVISMELHHTHIPQRANTTTAHEDWNLTKATPWGHASMDPHRDMSKYELIKITKGTGSFS